MNTAGTVNPVSLNVTSPAACWGWACVCVGATVNSSARIARMFRPVINLLTRISLWAAGATAGGGTITSRWRRSRLTAQRLDVPPGYYRALESGEVQRAQDLRPHRDKADREANIAFVVAEGATID